MKIRDFTADLWLPSPPETVFGFFADPANLAAITPPWLGFRTLMPVPIAMTGGALIDHRLRIRGVPVRWRSRIAVWDPPRRFVDEQIRGPYRLWVHEHVFEPLEGGTLVRDRVRYSMALDFLLHDWLVRPDIERIFQHRANALRSLIGRSHRGHPACGEGCAEVLARAHELTG